MGRGRDKTISARDIMDMSPGERVGLANILRTTARTGNGNVPPFRVKGTAVVRDATTGNARYTDRRQAGRFNEDKIQ